MTRDDGSHLRRVGAVSRDGGGFPRGQCCHQSMLCRSLSIDGGRLGSIAGHPRARSGLVISMGRHLGKRCRRLVERCPALVAGGGRLCGGGRVVGGKSCHRSTRSWLVRTPTRRLALVGGGRGDVGGTPCARESDLVSVARSPCTQCGQLGNVRRWVSVDPRRLLKSTCRFSIGGHPVVACRLRSTRREGHASDSPGPIGVAPRNVESRRSSARAPRGALAARYETAGGSSREVATAVHRRRSGRRAVAASACTVAREMPRLATRFMRPLAWVARRLW